MRQATRPETRDHHHHRHRHMRFERHNRHELTTTLRFVAAQLARQTRAGARACRSTEWNNEVFINSLRLRAHTHTLQTAAHKKSSSSRDACPVLFANLAHRVRIVCPFYQHDLMANTICPPLAGEQRTHTHNDATRSGMPGDV